MENAWANDKDRYVLAAQPGQVAGAARMTSTRSQRIVQNGLPDSVLHNKNPYPGCPALLRGRVRNSCP